jgi:hypothetical protein
MTILIENIIIIALIRTEGNAKINICTACFLNTYQSEFNELSKIRGGKKMSKIPRGSIYAVDYIDSPMTPSSFENLPSKILTTKSVGVYGMNGIIF